jgi:Tn3 transposase DDE domain
MVASALRTEELAWFAAIPARLDAAAVGRVLALVGWGEDARGEEIPSNHREEVEMTALCLRILQASLVFVNTLMLQDVLAEPEWSALLTPLTVGGSARCSGSACVLTAK